MVTIARKHHYDIRMVSVFRDLAEDRTQAFEDYDSGGFPPEIELGCYYAPGPRRYDDTRGEHRPIPGEGGSCGSGGREEVVATFRAEIMIYYADAIEVIVKSGDFASQELRELERQALLSTPFPKYACRGGSIDDLLSLPLLGTCLEPVLHIGENVIPNVGGLPSLLRLASYELQSGAPASARAAALAE